MLVILLFSWGAQTLKEQAGPGIVGFSCLSEPAGVHMVTWGGVDSSRPLRPIGCSHVSAQIVEGLVHLPGIETWYSSEV